MVSPLKPLSRIIPSHIRIYSTSSHRMPHNLYPFTIMQCITPTHHIPTSFSDKIALAWIKALKPFFNTIMRYDPPTMNPTRWINYMTLIQTFTGVTGMVGGMSRHLQSLRLMKHDNGWIHRLLEQADNQRFHLIVFMNMKRSSYMTRLGILMSQAMFMTSFFSCYVFFPKYCHRFVGYFEETLVEVYTQMLQQIDRKQSPIHSWRNQKATEQTAEYYHLDKNLATFRDIILAIRADKANHREMNHYFAQVPSDVDIEQQEVRIINKGEQFTIKRQQKQI